MVKPSDYLGDETARAEVLGQQCPPCIEEQQGGQCDWSGQWRKWEEKK